MDSDNAARIKIALSSIESEEARFRNALVAEPALSDALKSVFWELGHKGWSRKKFFDVAHFVQFNEELTDDQHDAIAEFMLNVLGECQLKFVWKLPSEPQSEDSFEKFFRGEV